MPTGSAESASRRPRTAAPSPVRNASYGLHRYGYVVGKTLGSGAYAKVKAGHSLKLNRPVAIKIISKKSAPKDMLEKFLPREIETLKAMAGHENVVTLLESIVTESEVYLALEYAERGDLLDYINSRKFLGEETARRLFADLVRGLAACHARGIVHRDLKCENLLLDAQLRLKITDFGFSRRQEKGASLETYCGSYAYAAPEVVLGDPYDGEPADVWSIGVVLYAMVSGRLPFKDNDIKTLLSDIASKITFRSRTSKECQDLIRGMLTFNVNDRLTLDQIKAHPWMGAAGEAAARPAVATPTATPSTSQQPPAAATDVPPTTTSSSSAAEEEKEDGEKSEKAATTGTKEQRELETTSEVEERKETTV